MKNFTSIKEILKNKKSKQIFSLYSSMIISLIIGIGVSVFNTRVLGPEYYGDFRFIFNLINFASVFFTFGFFVSCGRLLASANNQIKNKELLGSSILIMLSMSFLVVLFFYVFSFFSDNIFDNTLGNTIRFFSPFFFVIIVSMGLEKILQGNNKIYHLSFIRFSPKTIYLIFGLIIYSFFTYNLYYALAIHFISLFLFQLIIIISLKPKFSNIKKNINKIFTETQNFGLHIYTGVISGVATKHLGGIMVAFYLDTINVGYFALAKTITMPLELIPAAIGTTYYKDFVKLKEIPSKVFRFSIFCSIIFLVLYLFCIKYIFLFLYTDKFIPAMPLVYILAFAHILRGFGFLINKFLGAKGQGKTLRNIAMIVGISYVVGFPVFIKYFGLIGAAITVLISYLIYTFLLYYNYKKYLKNAI